MIGLLATAIAQVAAPVPPDAIPAVRRMIDDQIASFGRDDAAGAWKHVAPTLQRQFGTAENFLRVVREGYAPVYRPRAYAFREVAVWRGEPAIWLDVTGPDGASYRALYLLEAQADGSWRTAGCLLFAVEPPPPGSV